MRPAGPDERLRRADALVYVADLDEPTCGEDEAHHLLDVLRLAEGATIAASDGNGRFRLCRLATPAERGRGRRARQVALEPAGAVVAEAVPDEAVTVAFALVKGDRSEWAVQKLTELGVDRIVPLLTARTVVRLDPGAAARRADRLRRVAREAGAQARRSRLPEVGEPTGPGRFLAGEPDPGAVAVAEPGGGPLTRATRCVVVGPEGGWTDDELALIETRVGLGPTILRTETAAVVAGVLLTVGRKASLSVLTND